MNSLAKTFARSSILLLVSFSFGTVFATPADYSIYPHLAGTATLSGDNQAIEGFNLWGTDYFAVCNTGSGLTIHEVSGDVLSQVGAFDGIGLEIDIAVVDWFGYMVSSGGLTALSLGDPQAPLSLGFLFLPGSDIHQLEVSPPYAYIACGTAGLAVVDITSTSTMYVMAWYGGDVESVSLDGNHLGVTNNGRFELLDVSTPAAPSLIGFAESTTEFDYYSAVVHGPVVYTMTGAQVDRWDFTDPGAPVMAPSPAFLRLSSAAGGPLRIQGSELQVIGNLYLGFFDFATGTLLRETRQAGTARDADIHAGLLVTTAPDGLHVFHDHPHSHPEPAGEFDPSGFMSPRGIMLGHIIYGYSETQDLTLRAADLNNGAAHLWDLELGFGDFMNEFDHRGTLLSIYGGNPSQLKLVTVSRYGAIERGSYALPDLNHSANWRGSIDFLDDEHLVILDHQSGSDPGSLSVLDITDPDDPQPQDSIGIISTNSATLWTAGSLVLVGHNYSLELIDARDPTALVHAGTLTVGGSFIFTSGDWLYSVHTASGGAVLKSWDLSNPASPVVAGEMHLPRLAGFVPTGGFAYQEETGLILDLADPAHPVPAGNLSLANRSLSRMDYMMPGDQYILVGDPYRPPVHYLHTQGGTGEVSAVPDETPEALGFLNLRATPNPFNPRVTIQFELQTPVATRIEVFDVRGRRVATLGTKRRDAGVQSVDWDGTDREGKNLPSGVYLARVVAGQMSVSLKIVLAR
ncbi:MAG: FlgD immunoglobulin-like domain containing protein [Candidatus Krumholzibacteriota bacterium]